MPRLIPLEGPRAGRGVELTDGARLGRATDCEVRLPHASVSRVHARVERRGSAWVLVDAGSRNGVRTREGRVEELELDRTVEVWLGEVHVRIEPSGTAPSAPPVPETDDDLDDFEFEDEAAVEQAELAATGEDLALEDPADIELEATAVAPRPTAPPPSPALAARQKQAAFLSEEARRKGGLLRGELDQQPAWIQALVFALAVAVTGGLGWFAYSLVTG